MIFLFVIQIIPSEKGEAKKCVHGMTSLQISGQCLTPVIVVSVLLKKYPQYIYT